MRTLRHRNEKSNLANIAWVFHGGRRRDDGAWLALGRGKLSGYGEGNEGDEDEDARRCNPNPLSETKIKQP